MRSIVTFEGIDDAIENLQYNNKRSLKYKLIDTIRKQYDIASNVDSVTEIDTDFLVKILWETGDDQSLIRNRRKNYNSIKSSVNSDLKELYNKGLNREGIIIGSKNIFDMSEEAKSEILESFSYGSGSGETQIPLDKITDVLNVINAFISGKESGIEYNEKFEQLKEIIKDISDKVGVTVVSQGDSGEEMQLSQDFDASENMLYQSEKIDAEDVPEDEIDEALGEAGEGIPEELEDEAVDELEEPPDEELEEAHEEIEGDPTEEADDEGYEDVEIDEIPEDEVEEVLDEAEEGIPEELEGEAVEELEEIPDEELEEVQEETEGDLTEEADDEGCEDVEVDEIPEDEIEDVLDEAEEGIPEELEGEAVDELEEVPDEELEEAQGEIEGDLSEEADDEGYEDVKIDEIPEDEIEEVLDEAEEGIPEELEGEAVDELEELPDEELEEAQEETEGDLSEEADDEEYEDAEVDKIPEDEIEEVIDEAIDDSYEYILDDILEDYDTTGYLSEESLEKAPILADNFDRMLSEAERYYNRYLMIPGGKYLTDTTPPDASRRKKNYIQLSDFYFGKFPVTNNLFELFIEKTGYVTTAERLGFGMVYKGRYRNYIDEKTGRNTLEWTSSLDSEKVEGACWFKPNGPGSSLLGKRNHPVVQVSLEDAMAFAAWTGKRLPAADEWEAASRTSTGLIYPWGNMLKDGLCNIESTALGDTTPVDKYEDASNKFGVADLIGNVLEWTVTKNNMSGKTAFVVKGGSWISGDNVNLAQRFMFEANTTSNILGFRCVAYR